MEFGVERECLKFKTKKMNISLSVPFSEGAQTYFGSGAVVASEANLPLGSCDRQNAASSTELLTTCRVLTSFRSICLFCLTNSHAFLGMYFRCSAESIPMACLRQIPVFPGGSWNTPDAVQS